MATPLIGVVGLLWAQVWEARPGQPSLVTFPEMGSKRPIVWIALAWPHAPQQSELGRFIAEAASHTHYPAEASHRLRAWAEKIGLSLHAWSGPEGAALTGTVPRSYLLEAVDWLYSALTLLPLYDSLQWQWHYRHYMRSWAGFHLERDLEWRLLHPTTPPGQFTHAEALAYLQRYLQPDSLCLLIGASLSVRERSQLRQKAFRPSLRGEALPVSDPIPASPPPSREEENLWAYPAYVCIQIQTPPHLPEKIAFLEAFLTRWHQEAPPLRWRGYFWGAGSYILLARTDGSSYQFLRLLGRLSPLDSTELQSWQSAYALARLRLRSQPEAYPDLWIGTTLRRDTVALPDTLPREVWLRGWPFSAQGFWLYNDLLLGDTLFLLSEPAPDSTVKPASRPDFVWLGEGAPPFAEWASALRLYQPKDPDRPCELIGYYYRKADYKKRLETLHALRRTLIQQYGVPPQRLRVHLQKATPDLPAKTLRLRCE